MSRHACSIINIQVRDIYSWRDDQRLLVNFMFKYFRLVSIMVMVVVTVFLLVLPLVLPPLPPPPLLLLLVPVLIMAALVFLAFSPQKYQVIQHPPPCDHTIHFLSTTIKHGRLKTKESCRYMDEKKYPISQLCSLSLRSHCFLKMTLYSPYSFSFFIILIIILFSYLNCNLVCVQMHKRIFFFCCCIFLLYGNEINSRNVNKDEF